MWVIAIKDETGRKVATVHADSYDDVYDILNPAELPHGYTTETLEEGTD